MFRTLETLFRGASARAEDKVTDRYALELIDQKLREGQAALADAKASLAALIQRQRSEEKQIAALKGRVDDLQLRAGEALQTGAEALALEAAASIAQMENEITLRSETLTRIETRVVRLRSSVEAANRRLIDLRQGAIAAKAVRREANAQRKINASLSGTTSLDDAEALIARVVNDDDPFEQSEILAEIDRGLNGQDVADRMAEQGLGPANKSTAASVLERLKSNA